MLRVPQNAVVFQAYGVASRRILGLTDDTTPPTYSQTFVAGADVLNTSADVMAMGTAIPSVFWCRLYPLQAAGHQCDVELADDI